jgi:hypothetical protein
VKATIRWVILTAVRDRLFGGLFIMLMVAAAAAMFMGQSALIEQLQMALVFTAGAGRLILVLGLSIFVAFHIQRMFETREVEAVLSRAISRLQFVLAYWLGFAVLAAVLAGIFGAAVVMIAGPSAGALLWAATLLAECVVVMAVAVFAGFMLERATATVLFTMGFYALARLVGFFVGIREHTAQGGLNAVTDRLLDLTILFIPRLDMFAQTKWLVYPPGGGEVVYLAAQTVLFLALVLAAAMFDLSRKQF